MTACGDDSKDKSTPDKKTASAKKAETAGKTAVQATKTSAKAKKTEKKEAKKDSKKPKAAGATVTVNAEGVAELTINAMDSMKYKEKLFTVKAGQKVKLTLKHLGKLPKNAMGHNIVILKAGTNISEFATAAGQAADNEYFPKDKADSVIAYSKLIGGGESATVEFVAPAPGTYTYICTYPGHWSVMQGKMVVE